MLELIFPPLHKREVPDIPDHPGVQAFQATSRGDDSPVEGWSWRPEGSHVGTIFFLHGFSVHSRISDSWPHWIDLASIFNLALVAIDLRRHGRSSDRWPTWGTAESWDLLGSMDRAEELGFRKPYILSGGSLGSMAAQRAAVVDGRVKGCFLAEPPAFPFHAMGSVAWEAFPGPTKILAPAGPAVVGSAINLSYGWDILTDGDLREHPEARKPVHEPLLFFIMGTKDKFNIARTREIFDFWYADVPGSNGGDDRSCSSATARKWFVEVPNAHHAGTGQPSIYDWKHLAECQEAFLRRCLI